jgi:predicted dehydrogenase
MNRMTQQRRRFVQVGVGGRGEMYTRALTETFAEHCELSAICDTNPGRMELTRRRLQQSGLPAVKSYPASEFERMIRDTRPQGVIVTSGPDVTHSDYICRALELGCDVITEKPLTIDEQRCRAILHTLAKTGRKLKVTFNYRYSPPRLQTKELIASGAIGEVLSVDFAWLLDTRHGADYFRRWHRRLANSGSLLVHKATHHFDLVNWWIGDRPEEVFCQASLRYYTPENAERMGLKGRSERCLTCALKGSCPFYLDLAGSQELKALYLDNEQYDGYFRDRCPFAPEIDIWDNMSVAVRYRGGALLSYQLHAYSPYEGYRIAFNGTRGRLEHAACENSYISGDGSVPGELSPGNVSITLIPELSQAHPIEVRSASGGHGGGDPVMLADLFQPDPPPDPLGCRADHRDGAYSVLVGVAAYRSVQRGAPVRISELLAAAPL